MSFWGALATRTVRNERTMQGKKPTVILIIPVILAVIVSALLIIYYFSQNTDKGELAIDSPTVEEIFMSDYKENMVGNVFATVDGGKITALSAEFDTGENAPAISWTAEGKKYTLKESNHSAANLLAPDFLMVINESMAFIKEEYGIDSLEIQAKPAKSYIKHSEGSNVHTYIISSLTGTIKKAQPGIIKARMWILFSPMDAPQDSIYFVVG